MPLCRSEESGSAIPPLEQHRELSGKSAEPFGGGTCAAQVLGMKERIRSQERTGRLFEEHRIQEYPNHLGMPPRVVIDGRASTPLATSCPGSSRRPLPDAGSIGAQNRKRRKLTRDVSAARPDILVHLDFNDSQLPPPRDPERAVERPGRHLFKLPVPLAEDRAGLVDAGEPQGPTERWFVRALRGDSVDMRRSLK